MVSSEYLNDLQIDFRQRSSFHIDIRKNAMCSLSHDDILLLKPYYQLMKTNIEKATNESKDIIRGLITAFSYSVISLMSIDKEKSSNTATSNTTTHNQQLLDKFMSLLKLYHISERSVAFYAGKMCLTPNYLSGAVKDYSSRSISGWINEYVVLEAKMMPKNSALNIQEIAYRLNFDTQSAFGKYFKLHTGLSPKHYRDSC